MYSLYLQPLSNPILYLNHRDKKNTVSRYLSKIFDNFIYFFFQTNFLKCISFSMISITDLHILKALKHFNVILFEMCFCFFIICFNADFHLLQYNMCNIHIIQVYIYTDTFSMILKKKTTTIINENISIQLYINLSMETTK